MAAEEHLDLIRDLSASEQGGALVELRRLAVVSGLEDDSIDALFSALDALTLTPQSVIAEHPNLVLMQRNPRMIDKKAAEVELVYRHFADNDLQDLTNPPGGKLVYTCDGSLADKSTQVDSAGNAIQLGYIYSADDASYGAFALAKRTVTTGAEVSVRIPTRVLRLAGVISGFDPDEVIGGILGYVNAATWKGGAARTWLCASATWSPWDMDSDGYKFAFTFEYNSDGWDQKAVFVHGATSQVVSDWKTNGDGVNASYKVVDWYKETNFDDYWPTFGFAPA